MQTLIERAIESLNFPSPTYLIVLGRVLQDQANFSEAQQKFQEALKVAKAWRDPNNEARVWWAIGDWHLAKRDYYSALPAYEFALARFKEWGWLRRAALVSHSIALVHEGKGNLHAAAHAHLQQAVSTFEKLKLPPSFLSPENLERARIDLTLVESQIPDLISE